MATLKALYRWGARQTQGFMASLFKLMKLTLSVPDPSTLSRRMKTLEVAMPILPKATARHIVIDSTGVKV
jgi:Transposase DDE domain